MNTDTDTDTDARPVRPVSIRLRLSPAEVRKLEPIQQFLGLPSLSATAARLALWNADTLSASLGLLPSVEVNPRALLRAAILDEAGR